MERSYASRSSGKLAAAGSGGGRQVRVIPLRHPPGFGSISSSSPPWWRAAAGRARGRRPLEWAEVALPCVAWIRMYRWKEDLQADLTAGITVGVMLVPQAMSYAKLAGLHPIYGLYTGFVPLFVYTIFGSSRQLAVGPVALVSLLVSNVLGAIVNSSSELYTELAILLALMVGILECLMGLLRLGWLIRFISHSVISGFTTASAIVIGLSQIKYFLGYNVTRSSKIIPLIIQQFSWPPFVMGSAFLGTLLTMKNLGKSNKRLCFLRASGPLTAVVLGTTFMQIFHPPAISVPIFSIPRGFEHVMSLMPTAVLITGVAILESVGIAKALAAKNGYELDSNKELFGLGIANICGSFFSAYPATGSFSRSAVNHESGAKTGLSGIIMGIIIGSALLFMTPLFTDIPQDHCSSRSCDEDLDGATTTCGKWHPGESQRPELDDAPIFTPTEEEFKDAIGYIASIRPQAEKYGICRIIPPSSWRPPCPLKEKSFWESMEFNTRVQQVDKLQNREPTKKRTQPRVQRKRKRRKRLRFGTTHRRPSSSLDSEDKFGFQSGSDFTLEEFQKYADEFKQEYFGTKGSDEISLSEIKNHKKIWEPSVEEIEGEYWRIVIGSTDEVEVDYGADLDTATFGSGFAKLSSDANKQDLYGVSCWNLNNLPRQPGSVISFENEDISGVVVPWLYVGMCFSSFCWHVEDHFLYSLNYMHFGEPKVWYGVPGGEAVKLEESMRKNLPKLFEEQPNLLHELVTQLSPTVLKSEGVSVYRAVQKPGEFVLTLPRAYHSGFNSGFNCAEAVNVAPVDWLPHGQCAVELYREQHRKTSISHDKLLLNTAKQAVKQLWMDLFSCKSGEGKYRWLNTCGKDGVLTSAIKTRVRMEGASREVNGNLKTKKMDMDYDSTDRECFSCFYDLHLSAVSCQCSPNRFACLSHTNNLCSCEMDRKTTFFRYSMEELNTLVVALEGDWTALCLWGQDHLGLVCPSGNVQKRNIDSGKSTEFSDSEIDNNVVSGFGGSRDLQKPAGFQQGNGFQNNSVDLNIEDPPSSSRIKEEHDKDRMLIDHGPLQNTDSPFRLTSCSSPSSLNCSSNLFSPSRNEASNSWNTTKKLSGVDFGNLAMHSDSQVRQMIKVSSGSDVASRPTSRCQVEPLDYGTVMIGKRWFDNQAIFPKGCRSRVTFYNVQDPTRQCFYVSEVLDAGPLGPLFKVTLEQVPNVSFTHISPAYCWDNVRDKVNEEIINLQKVGKCDLPDLLLPDSVNGLEMFGFLSPQIMQEIEALDPHHQCLDYWLSKTSSPVKELPSDSVKSTMVKCSSNSYVRLLGLEITKEPEQSRL